MPGMRVLADLKCEQCIREYYGDLRTGNALHHPMLLDKVTGQVYDPHNILWLANWLYVSYQQRTSEELSFIIEEFRPLRKVVVLNCLDALYGHSLLRLLNAQYYLDHHPVLFAINLDANAQFSMIIGIPKFH